MTHTPDWHVVTPLHKVVHSQIPQTSLPTVTIKDDKTAHEFLLQLWEDIDICESIYVLYLNRANKTIGYQLHSRGGISHTIFDVRLIIRKALELCATGIIVAHNHPSGNLAASDADRNMHTKIQQACKFFDIQLLDNLIVTRDSILSLAY